MEHLVDGGLLVGRELDVNRSAEKREGVTMGGKGEMRL